MIFRAMLHSSILKLIEIQDVPLLHWTSSWYGTLWIGLLLLGTTNILIWQRLIPPGRRRAIAVATVSLALVLALGGSRYESAGTGQPPLVEPTGMTDWLVLGLLLTGSTSLCLAISDALPGRPHDRSPRSVGFHELMMTGRRPVLEHLVCASGIVLCGILAVSVHGVQEHLRFWQPESNGGYEYRRFFANETEVQQATLVLFGTTAMFASVTSIVGLLAYVVARCTERFGNPPPARPVLWSLTTAACGAGLWTLATTVPWQLRIWTEIRSERGWILPATTVALSFAALWPLITLTLVRLVQDLQQAAVQQSDLQPHSEFTSPAGTRPTASDLGLWSAVLFAWYPLCPRRLSGSLRRYWWSRTAATVLTLAVAAFAVYEFEDWFDFEDWRGMLKRGLLPLLRVLLSLLLGLVAYRVFRRLFHRPVAEAVDSPSPPTCGATRGLSPWRFLGRSLLMGCTVSLIGLASWPLWGWQTTPRNVFARTVEFNDRHEFELSFLHWLLDFDGDGYAALLHGADANDTDPAIQAGGLPSTAQVPLPQDNFERDDRSGIAQSSGALADCPNVIVLFLEGVVPRAISAYRQRKLPDGLIATPAMDAIARDGAVFTQARCYYPSTWDAWLATCSGRHLHITEMNNAQPFGDRYSRYNNLYKVLQQAGINRWCHADCSPFIDLLVPQSLQDAPATNWEPQNPDFTTTVSEAEEEQDVWRGDKRNQRILAFLDDLQSDDRFFICEHMSDSHFPWKRTGRKRAEQLGFPDGLEPYEADALLPDGSPHSLYGAYLQVITRVDQQIGQLVDGLKSRGLYDKTAIVILSDHGCQWWEHEHMYYVGHLYEQSLHIPMIVRIPGGVPGVICHEPVQQVDLLPTLMELVGLRHVEASTRALPGRSLLPILRQKPFPAQRYRNRDVPLRTHYDTLGLLHDFETKLIFDRPSGTLLLFDLKQDPDEMQNLADSHPELLHDMLDRLRDYVSEHPELIGEIARSNPQP